MTVENLRRLVIKWDFEATGDASAKSEFGFLLDQLDYHAKREWRVFLPAEHPEFNPSYLERLAEWIGNVTSESEQKLLLKYAIRITFISHEDFTALYRTAMEREVTRWVASQVSAKLDAGWTNFNQLVKEEIHSRTWFCPITDSMDINEFYKVNHLKGIAHRPGFASLHMLATKSGKPNPELVENLREYMRSCGLARIVLMEDIVGSGSQCVDAIRWAVSSLGCPVLFVPLILCPNGREVLSIEESISNNQLTVRPVVELRRGDLLGPERRQESGWPITAELEAFANHVANRFSPHLHIFGYKNTGSSLVTFSNTPDNTLPIIHNKPSGGNWKPLFPRVFRD